MAKYNSLLYSYPNYKAYHNSQLSTLNCQLRISTLPSLT